MLLSYTTFEGSISMLFDDTNFNMGFFEIPGSDFTKELRASNLLSPKEGFLRGNLFKDEYEPFDNLTYYKLKPTSEKEALLFEIMALSFAVNDLNLYLDLRPNDKEAYDYFKELIHDKNELEEKYINMYGPLTLCDDPGTTYKWSDNPWPWENMGGSNYV